MNNTISKFLNIALLLALVACSGAKIERKHSDYHPQVGEDRQEAKMSSLITKSDEPLVLYGDKKFSGGRSNSGVGSSDLWKAALETIAFMPLVSSDSNGGAILTDWYASPDNPNEQFKFNIFILDSELQISSVKVTVFKQVKNSNGQWQPKEPSKELARNMEDSILKKAIAFRAKNTDKKK